MNIHVAAKQRMMLLFYGWSLCAMEHSEITYQSAKELTKTYAVWPVVQLTELAATQSNPYCFYHAIKKMRPEECKQVSSIAQKIGAGDLADQISHYGCIARFPAELRLRCKDEHFMETFKALLYKRIFMHGAFPVLPLPLDENERVVDYTMEGGLITMMTNGSLRIRDSNSNNILISLGDDMAAPPDGILQENTWREGVLFLESPYMVAFTNNAVKIWDCMQGSEYRTIVEDIDFSVAGIDLSNEGNALLYIKNGMLMKWPMSITEDPFFLTHVDPDIHGVNPMDGTHKIICQKGATVLLYDAQKDTFGDTLLMPREIAQHIVYDAAQQAITTTGQHGFSIWNPEQEHCTAAMRFDIPNGHVAIRDVLFFSYSDDRGQRVERQFVWDCKDAYICDGARNKILYTIANASLEKAQKIPNSSYVFARTAYDTMVYDVHTGAKVRSFTDKNRFICNTYVSTDNYCPILASVERDTGISKNSLCIYDFSTGELLSQSQEVNLNMFDFCHTDTDGALSLFTKTMSGSLCKVQLLSKEECAMAAFLTGKYKDWDNYLLLKTMHQACVNDDQQMAKTTIESLEAGDVRTFFSRYMGHKK